jgi:hypothetical protein
MTILSCGTVLCGGPEAEAAVDHVVPLCCGLTSYSVSA